MFIKKKYITLCVLVVILIITGYLNFAYNRNLEESQSVDNSGNQDDVDVVVKDKEESDECINNNQKEVEVDTDDFFTQYRIERDDTRKKEIDYIREVIQNKDTTDEMKNEAQRQLLDLTDNMEKEMSIEGLVKAKGFKEAIAILHEGSVNLIVDKEELKPEEVAQILSIVTEETGEVPENIKIIPKS